MSKANTTFFVAVCAIITVLRSVAVDGRILREILM